MHEETKPEAGLEKKEKRGSFSEKSEMLIHKLKRVIPATFPGYLDVSKTSEESRQRLIDFHRRGLVLDMSDKTEDQAEEIIKKGPQFFEVLERIGQRVELNDAEMSQWNGAIENARNANWKAHDEVVDALEMNNYKGEGIGYKVFNKVSDKIRNDQDLSMVEGYLSLLGY